MKKTFFCKLQAIGLIALLCTWVGFGPAAAQEAPTELDSLTEQEPASAEELATEQEPASGLGDDYLEGDVPDWLEDYGFEDTHDDPPVGRGAGA